MKELNINGLKIVCDVHVSDFGYVKRPWRERLFSWPWRPLKSRKPIYDPRVYLMDGVAIVSPRTFSILERDGFLKEGEIIGPMPDVFVARKALRKRG